MNRCCTFFLLLLTYVATAQPSKYTGNWSGAISGIPLIFHFIANGNGQLKGTMDSPKQGVTGLAIDEVAIIGDSIVCVIKVASVRYAATAANDSTLAGNWQQGGGTFSLVLHRQTGTDAKSAPAITHPQTPIPPFPYHSDSVEYDNPDKTVHLAATLTYPDKGGPFPAAIMITGSGQQDRDETIMGQKPFAVIADYLTRHGYAVLRVDDRSMGLSTGDLAHATSRDFAGDVETSFNWLKKRKEIDPKKIGLIGHSEGGMIAPMVAAQNKNIAFIIALAGPSSGYSTILYQSTAIQDNMRADSLILGYRATNEKMLLDNVRKSTDSASFMQGLTHDYQAWYASLPDSIRARASFIPKPDQYLPEIAPVTKTLLSPWYRFFINYDAAEYYEKIKCPVLLLGGEKDIQVPNAAAMTTISANHPNITCRLIPGVNHLFQHCHVCTVDEYGQLPETFSPEVLQIMTDWLDKHMR